MRNNALVPRLGSSATRVQCRRRSGVGRLSIYTTASGRTYLGNSRQFPRRGHNRTAPLAGHSIGSLWTVEGRTVRVRPIERFSEQILTRIVFPLLADRASYLLDVVRIIPGRRFQPCFLYFDDVTVTTTTACTSHRRIVPYPILMRPGAARRWVLRYPTRRKRT